MSWELIQHLLLHTYASVINIMFLHQNLNGLPKQLPNKINKVPCTICYTPKMTTLPKVTTFDNTNFKPGKIIHMGIAFNKVTHIQGFTSMLTLVCVKNRTLWVFPTASKISPVCTIRFILTTLKNEIYS